VAVETLKILLAIALITPLIYMTLPIEKHEYYYDEYYYIDHIKLATTSQNLPSRPGDLSRPIIGGVQIQVVPEFCSRSGDLISILYCLFIARTCTAGYAVRVNGTVGFISAGHCADFSSGFHVYQPIYLPPICYLRIIPGLPPRIERVCIPAPTFAGVVAWASREYDAMFVKFSNVTHLILHIWGRQSFHLGIAGIMRHYDVEEGLRVCKTGSTTGTTCGEVFKVVRSCDVEGNRVPRCIFVWARTAPGDSGSPLYIHHYIVIESRVFPAATLLGHVIGADKELGILVASSITNILESGFTLHRG
jgi:hypothetical protein